MQKLVAQAKYPPIEFREDMLPVNVTETKDGYVLDNGCIRLLASKSEASYTLGDLTYSIDGAGKPSRVYVKGPREARVYYEDVFPGVDVSVHLRTEGIGLQKIIKTPDARHQFVTRISGAHKGQWAFRHDAMAVDNWHDKPASGRVVSHRQKCLSKERQYHDGADYCIEQRVLKKTWRIDPVTRARRPCSEVIYPIRLHQTTIGPYQLHYTNDAGRVVACTNTGSASVGSEGGLIIGQRNEDYHLGIVFEITDEIPAGSLIDSATMTVACVLSPVNNDTVTGLWYGDNAFTQSNFNLTTDRPGELANRTTASERWDLPASYVPNDPVNIDLQEIVQELVDDRGGWTVGDLIRFAWDCDATQNYGTRIWAPHGYRTGPADQQYMPSLEITYSAPGAPGLTVIRRRRS